MENKADNIELEIEELAAKIYWKLYQLGELGEYQRECDIMGTLINMLIEDREFVREKYKEHLANT